MSNPFKRVKSVEQSISDTDEPDTKLRRDITAWDLTVFGVAVVVGAGIFTLTARTAGNLAGPSVSVAFVLAAIACALAALCYAEFARGTRFADQLGGCTLGRSHPARQHPRAGMIRHDYCDALDKGGVDQWP